MGLMRRHSDGSGQLLATGHRVRIAWGDGRKFTEIETWARENCARDWTVSLVGDFAFECEHDAAKFKLFWG